MTTNQHSTRQHHFAFTMVEILLAMLILGIGLIMVATVLPVGANWNRQNVEESIASQIARNAQAIILTKFKSTNLSSVSTTLVPIPGIGSASTDLLTTDERAFSYGSIPAYPAKNVANSLYFWTALIRLDPDPNAMQRNRYEVFIFVFKKGSADQTFTNAGALGRAASGETGVPYLLKDSQDNVLRSSGANYANFVVGAQGVGETSGSVFRKLASVAGAVNVTSSLTSSENVYYAPPADGASVSPLIYIYQTSVAF